MLTSQKIKALIAWGTKPYRIAKETGVPENTVRRIWNGETDVSAIKLETAEKLEAYYDSLDRRRWDSLPFVDFEEIELSAIEGGYLDKKNKMVVTYGPHVSNYADLKEWMGAAKNHYRVTWDFAEFFDLANNQKYDWCFPHKVRLLDNEVSKIDGQIKAQTVLKYYQSSQFTPYNKTMSDDNLELVIINYPVQRSSITSIIKYVAGAADQDGNVYEVEWNVNRLISPVSVELSLDYSRYCIHCLKNWTDYSTKCVKDEHQFVINK